MLAGLTLQVHLLSYPRIIAGHQIKALMAPNGRSWSQIPGSRHVNAFKVLVFSSWISPNFRTGSFSLCLDESVRKHFMLYVWAFLLF